MPSATTADSSDSIAPSMAMVKAGPASSIMRASEISGSDGAGNPRGRPPKALPMVATPSKRNSACTAVATTSATSGPGTRCSQRTRGAPSTSSRLPSASAVVAACHCGSACSSCHSFSWKWVPATGGSPKKSRHCPTKMITPMPAVKPTITGAGM
ncbi:hypothetical protein D9M69_430180 [compost metagenome]